MLPANKNQLFIKGRRGFTLIELLVVIAIIGILSSVVLASLSTARSKGLDTKIKAQLSAIRAEAELYYDTNASYGSSTTSCSSGMFSSSGMTNLISTIPTGSTPQCVSTGTGYAVETALLSDSGAYWCVDSSGSSKRTTAVTIGSGDVSC